MDENEKEVPISQIIITFAAPGSAIMDLNFVNVNPLQAAAAAWLLEKQAEVGFVQDMAAKREKEAMNRIAVPGVQVGGQKVMKP